MARGDLAAHDELCTLLYEKGSYAEATDHHLKAYVGGYYKYNERLASSRNLYRMYENNWIPTNSDAYRLFRHMQSEGGAVRERATKAVTTAAIVGFVGYTALAYAGGIHGVLRDFSLIITGAVARLCWKLVLSGFEK